MDIFQQTEGIADYATQRVLLISDSELRMSSLKSTMQLSAMVASVVSQPAFSTVLLLSTIQRGVMVYGTNMVFSSKRS